MNMNDTTEHPIAKLGEAVGELMARALKELATTSPEAAQQLLAHYHRGGGMRLIAGIGSPPVIECQFQGDDGQWLTFASTVQAAIPPSQLN
jgi:hypothetical protein